jgi:regulatory protein
MTRPPPPAHAYALQLLGMRAYSTRDLGRKLERKGYTREEAETVIARLSRSGLLDDVRFAEQYARSRIVNDSASPRRVVQLLLRYGISRPTAEAAVARTIEDEELDTGAAAERVARRKAAALTGLEPAVARRRLYGYLARRGYDLEHIRAAVSAALH